MKSIATKGLRILLVAALTLAAAAWLSVTETWVEQQMRDGHTAAVRRVAFSPDGRLLASGSDDGSLTVWQRDGFRKEAVLAGHQDGVRELLFAVQQNQIASADGIGTSRLWEFAHQQPLESLSLKTPITEQYTFVQTLAFSPDLRWFATFDTVYERTIGNVACDIRKVANHRRGFIALAFSHDGQRLAGVAHDGQVFLLETGTWRVLAREPAPRLEATRMSFSPDGQRLAIGDQDGHVLLWSVNPLQQILQLGKHKTHVEAVVFSPNGSRLASASDDQTICLWDVDRLRFITQIDTHTSPVYSVAFSPDGSQLLSGEHDGTVRLYTRQRSLWGWSLE